MPLTHYALLNTQPRAKTYKLFDGHGLYLQVAPTGGKWWRVKYRLGGRGRALRRSPDEQQHAKRGAPSAGIRA